MGDSLTSGACSVYLHVWQSWVEIEYFSVAYFESVTVVEVLYHRTSIKGRARTCCVDMPGVRVSMQCA